jgi:hypothetical protein
MELDSDSQFDDAVANALPDAPTFRLEMDPNGYYSIFEQFFSKGREE